MRRLALLALIGVLAGGLWHARPVLVWHWTVAPAIERSDHPERVRPRRMQVVGQAPEGWARLRVGDFAIRAPIRSRQSGACRSCASGCQLELDRGRLTLFERSSPGSYDEAVAVEAPSERDISLWRGRSHNWRTLNALAGRALATYELPEVYRFEGPASRGIVTRVESGGVERFVAHVFPRGPGRGRVFALSRTGPEALRQVLASAEFSGAPGVDGCD